MIDSKPTESLGKIIAKWDSFYAANFRRVYHMARQVTYSPAEANRLTERVFMHLALTHPQLILEENGESLYREITHSFPQLLVPDEMKDRTRAKSLLNRYYVPN